ncbi:enoyl-CoA hydratase [Vibrio variabilis]|uniref:Enoyl-CoA hydratase n=1 Tax=Vibrio variabilis TaxID=990271 RepID=A0ABQ0JI88_9VIBR|nr:enoyl-CoA hydratase [Vibrio variabilis]
MENLARRIAQFPAESINACKQTVYESIDKPIDDALKAEPTGYTKRRVKQRQSNVLPGR